MNIDDRDDDDYYVSDEPVPAWFKLAASLVLFSPFITAMLYVVLK